MNSIITGLLIGLVLIWIVKSKPWKYLPSGAKIPGWFKKHWFMTIVAVMVCLALLPQILWLGGLGYAAVASGPDQVIRGTPRSEWGIGKPNISHSIQEDSPQGNNLGGSIYWEEDALVRIREGVSTEEVDENGICFAGILPPQSSVHAIYNAYTDSEDWSASLIDHTALTTFLSRNILEERGTTDRGRPVAIVSMPTLVSEGRYEDENMCNETKSTIAECYIQIGGNGPKQVQVEHNSTRMIQFEVQVGLREVSFTIPAGKEKKFWVVPVHHKAYQACLSGEPVPAEGLIRNHLAIVLIVNGQRQVLDKALLLSTKGESTDVTLVLNSAVENIEEEVTPATVIVGTYLK